MAGKMKTAKSRSKDSGSAGSHSFRRTLKRIWHFLWEEDSWQSWAVNIVLAFVLIKFVVYPGVGFAMGTDYPVVAVVSGSMEHKTAHPCITYSPNRQCDEKDKIVFELCGKTYFENKDVNLNFFWENCGAFYEDKGIGKEEFSSFDFKNGFNTGDIIVLKGVKPENIRLGDVIVFRASQAYPIIHRVVQKEETGGGYLYSTKGDHNSAQTIDDINITEDAVIGKAIFRIPCLGWVKIGAFRLLGLFSIG